jgi:hypothetical protein
VGTVALRVLFDGSYRVNISFPASLNPTAAAAQTDCANIGSGFPYLSADKPRLSDVRAEALPPEWTDPPGFLATQMEDKARS